MMPASTLRTLACALLGAALCGCAGWGHVEAWEKGNLARPDMRFDSDALDARFTQHVYTSKEAASGGGSVGGGGCGCN
jgi:hypothetical protein